MADPEPSILHHFSIEYRIPVDHPLQLLKKLPDWALSRHYGKTVEAWPEECGRSSTPQERLLNEQLLIAFCPAHSDCWRRSQIDQVCRRKINQGGLVHFRLRPKYPAL